MLSPLCFPSVLFFVSGFPRSPQSSYSVEDTKNESCRVPSPAELHHDVTRDRSDNKALLSLELQSMSEACRTC